VDYANSLSDDLKASAQFVFRLDGGAPTPLSYRVITDKYFVSYNRHLPSVKGKWHSRGGEFNSLDEMFDYLKLIMPENVADRNVVFRFLGFWNPLMNAPGGDAVFFFISTNSGGTCNYSLEDREFADPKEALDCANGELVKEGVLFTSQINPSRQLHSSVRIVVSDCAPGIYRDWELIENDENGIPFNSEAAVEYANKMSYRDLQFVPIIDLSQGQRSRIAIFYQR
jgi:hypothetical protein